MQKGIILSVQILIEGDAPPAEDFSQTGRQVALQVLQQGLQHFQGPYTVQVQRISPMEGGDDDNEEPASGDALSGQPLLSYTPAGQQRAAASSAPSAASTPTPPNPTAGQPPAPTTEAEQPEKHHFWDRG